MTLTTEYSAAAAALNKPSLHVPSMALGTIRPSEPSRSRSHRATIAVTLLLAALAGNWEHVPFGEGRKNFVFSAAKEYVVSAFRHQNIQ